MILKVPASLYPNAKRDIENFIRDIANVTERGSRPFIRRRKKIKHAIKEYLNPFNPIYKTFAPDFKCHDNFLRYVHIDLGLTRDAVGIGCVHVPRFVEREELDSVTKEVRKVLEPLVRVDFWGRIVAPKNEEIILSEVREIIYDLSLRGFYFGLITFDRFQSIESVQTLRRTGYLAGHLSVDRTTSALMLDPKNEIGYKKVSTEGNFNAAHGALKDLMYDDRLEVPSSLHFYDFDYFLTECQNAQVTKTGKIDHPPGGTLDVEQAVAGACFHAVNNERMAILTEAEEQTVRAQDSYYKDVEAFADHHLLSNRDQNLGRSIDPRKIEEFI